MGNMFLDKILSLPSRAEGEGEDLEALKGLPLVLYGAGWYAPYVRGFLARSGLEVAGCFVDDGFTSSAETVSFDEVRGKFGRFNVVIGFADAGLARRKLAQKDCGQVAGIYFFDVMGALLDYSIDRAYVERHKEEFGMVYELLCDGLSRETYAAFLGSKLGAGPEGLCGVWRKDQYFPQDIFRLSDREVFVDGGAYTGDTLLAFIRKTKGEYERCYAFEPAPENLAKLNSLAEKQRFRDVSVIGKGLWSMAETLRFAAAEGLGGSAISPAGNTSIAVDSVDNVAPDATFIKLDVEGAELEALKGAAGTIKRNRPKLAVCLYHRPGDLFEIPLFLKSLVPEYRFYLRQHQPVSCELVLYAVI